MAATETAIHVAADGDGDVTMQWEGDDGESEGAGGDALTAPAATPAAAPAAPSLGSIPSAAAQAKSIALAAAFPTNAEVVKQVCTNLGTFHAMWGKMRSLAVGHMRLNPPAQAILDDYQRMLDVHIPRLLRRTIAWRSAHANTAVLIKFSGVRYVRPDNLRSTSIGRERFKDGLTAFERAQKRRWSYCLYVMLNVETTTINCDPAVDLEQVLNLLPEQEGEITPEQEALLKARSRMQRNLALEAPLVKIPMPLGAEAKDDPEWVPPTDPKAGEFFVNKSIAVHSIYVPATNRPIPVVVKDTVDQLFMKVYCHADGTYRSTATMVFTTPYRFDTTPNVHVQVAYPRKESIPLYNCFMLLHMFKVGWILRLMWPNGVPPAERLAYIHMQTMLNTQARQAREGDIYTRDQLFSTLKFTNVVDGDEDDVDSFSELKRYQRACDSTVAELLRQQGTFQVRTTMLAKAVALASYGKLTVLTAFRLRPLTNPHSAINLRRQHLSFALCTLLSQSLRTYLIPVVRRSVRAQVVQGGSVALGSQLMERRAPQLTGRILREFTGNKDTASSSTSSNLRFQSKRYGPTPEAQVAVHSTVSNKGATLAVRGHDKDALGDIDLWHTPDGPAMGLKGHSPLGSHIRPGLFKDELQVMLCGLFAEAGGIHSLAPPFSEADRLFILSTRSVDFLVTEEVMMRGIKFLTEGGRMKTLVYVNRAIIGWVSVGREEALAELLAARRRGHIRWDVSIFPCELGVEVDCEAGSSLRPVIWIGRMRDLFLLFVEAAAPDAVHLRTEEALILAARNRGIVTYLSTLEINERGLVVAMDPYDLRARSAAMLAKGTPFVAMELHPFIVQFGITLGRIPFAPLGAAPRLTFPGQMIPHAAHARQDKTMLQQSTSIANAQRMPIQTLVAKAFRPLLFTNSAVILVWGVPGCQDDAWILNKGSVERGLLAVNLRVTYSTTNSDNYRVLGQEALRSIKRLTRQAVGDRSKLDKYGVIKRGSKVVPHETILFQRACTKKDASGTISMLQDASILHTRTTSVDDVWTVDKVQHGCEENGWRFEVQLSRYVPLEVGDKIATLHGQKATISAIWPSEDMPTVVSGPMAGMVPDIIMNPTAYSRMTVNNAVTIQACAVAAHEGRIIDATPYEPFDMRALEAASKKMGFETGGKVLMMDGRTGQTIGNLRGDGKLEDACVMAMGLVPLMRLWKHNPRTVVQACGHTNRRSATTGQPLKGRGDDGSCMRYGNLVRNAVTSHGAPAINQDAVQRSNMSSYPICGACGRVNPAAPYDYIQMAATKAPGAARVLQAMVDECEVCVYCRERAVRETELPMVMKLISDLTSALNMSMSFDIQPKPGQEIREAMEAAKREFLDKVKTDDLFRLTEEEEGQLAELRKEEVVTSTTSADENDTDVVMAGVAAME